MKTYYAIGLMSGTSLDGLDLCYVRFEYPEIKYEILKAETIDYSDEWVKSLKDSIFLSGEELTKLDVDYGFLLGEICLDFIQRNKIKNIDFIASHGHTVFHNPRMRYTLQIGNGDALFHKTQIPVVYDFRSADVISGGQGAPLVPIGDKILFSEYEACLNLGGFSNISFQEEGKRIAFDICPVNIVLNRLAERLGLKYDKNGKIASKGKIDKDLLKKLNSLDFYQNTPPKSLGVEWCNQFIFPLLEDSNLKIEDLIAVFTEHAAIQISNIFNNYKLKNVLITGGGALNKFLIHRINQLSSTEIIIPNAQLIEYKEALIFALMGMLRIENEINILSSVTGAPKDSSAGYIIKQFD